MAKLTASLTRKWSAMVAPDVWETAEVSFSAEDEGEKSEAAMALRAYVKAQVDAEMKRQKDEIYEQYGLAQRPAAVQFAEEVGATVEVVREEKPPLPDEEPIPTADDKYRKTFRIQSFEVAETQNGDKYLRCFGKAPWKRPWVPAWNDVAELVFGGIDEMDVGQVLGPPNGVGSLDAVVQMKDDVWKGRKFIGPDKVIEWERVG